jgi:hypothetical protein
MDRFVSIKTLFIVHFLRTAPILLIALLSGLFAAGQVKFTTIASGKEIGRSEYLQIEFVVENAKQIDQLSPPDFPGFRIVQGPVQSSGMSVVNGNMSQYKALSFVIQPEKTGKFTIGGATALVDGKHMQSNPVTITVTTATTGPGTNANPGNGMPGGSGGVPNPFMQPSWPDPLRGEEPAEVDKDYILRPGENIHDKIRRNLFVRVQVDKNTCYVGEPIVATYKLYSRLSSESRVTKRPSLNGFSVYDMVDPSQDLPSVEKLHGKPFTVHIIRKTQLIPLQAGTINLDPVEVENTVHFVKVGSRQEPHRSGNSLRDLFDQLTDNDNMGPEIEQNITLDTKPVTITVKPLPEENKPVDFNGAVGNFSLEASVTGKNMSARDEGTLHVVVRGKGNLPVIDAPAVSWPAGIEGFDPKAKEDVNKTVVPMSGTKSFDFAFTPDTAGHYTIPAIRFPYFDPVSQNYKTAESAPLYIQVAPGTNRPTAANTMPAVASAVEGQSWTEEFRDFVQAHLEWIFAIFILALVAYYLGRQNIRMMRAEEVNKAAARKAEEEMKAAEMKAEEDRQAAAIRERALPEEMAGIPSASYLPASVISDPLEEARRLFDNRDYKGFYREINRAVWKSLARKLDLPASELNKNNIARQLRQNGWDFLSIQLLEDLLHECELSLYTPAYDTHNMQQLLRQAESLMIRLA